MTLIQFCLCYVCWFAALERLPAATASIGTLLVPVVGVLSAAAMLHVALPRLARARGSYLLVDRTHRRASRKKA